MKCLCSYCEYKNKCSAEAKTNCELLEDCDEFERREVRVKNNKKKSHQDK